MDIIYDKLIILPAILIGLTFHEFAHGLMADYLGDPTPRSEGRLTLNPLPHLDPIGFLMLLLAGFGWAKPVRWNPALIQRTTTVRKGMMLVSIAGPGMNLLLALVSMILFKLTYLYAPPSWGNYALILLEPCITINLVLMVFNLIPVPPLDGSKVLMGVLPISGIAFMENLERYGFLILIVLIIPIGNNSIIGLVLHPVLKLLLSLLDLATGFII